MKLPDRIVVDRVVPVARGLDRQSAPRMAAALLSGGIGSLEVTVEGSGGTEAIAAAAREDILVGAGTVTTLTQAEDSVAAGASFLVAPHLDPDLIAWGEEHQVAVIPGALTPTEIAHARSLTPQAVKLFPAHVGGPQYVRSLLGPYPDLKLLPTGGVTVDNIAEYLEAGAIAVGVGGWLTGLDDYDEVARRARLLVSEVAGLGSDA